ncbi:MAG TPA: GNAT family N-acetyltransferase [Gaiellaceae bacterium]|nr:GNAT family N-acetyltransferase [Gaiellaceae bacterium]
MLIPLADTRWRSFVASCPEAGPFHHPAWAELLADCYGFRPLALVVTGDDGALEAGLPVLERQRPLQPPRRLSLPYTDHCPPLCRSDDARPRLAAAVAAAGRLELRAPLEGPGLTSRVCAVSHTLELAPGPEELRRGFQAQMRRNVVRAQREGVVVRPGERRSDLVDVFYGLHLRTRRRQGVPVQPRRFFRLLWDGLAEPGLARVLLAYAGATPVAGAVFLAWNGTVVYKFGASDVRYRRLRPNNLLFWEAIRWACERGDRRLDFGRTDLGNEGLRAFKRGWGAREQPLVYTFAGTPPRALAHGRLGGALAAGIRRAPLVVCRLVGEAAYRFAA